MACPFCLDSSVPYGDIIRRGTLAYLLTNPDPVLPDSLMILPLRHVATPFELSPEEWLETQQLLLAAKTYLDARGATGYSLGWNVGEVGGQTVAHAHMHVIARFDDEPLAGKGIRHHLKQDANRRPAKRFK